MTWYARWLRPLFVLTVSVSLVAAIPGASDSFRSEARAQTPSRELVMLLDGSGSIDANEWELQKSGLVEALEDESFFPRDGSMSLAVIQWRSTSTHIEVPLTLIDSETVVTSLQSQIASITQLGGNTNPGDAVRGGTDLLLASGEPSASWILCMSTDGVTNSGESLSSAVAYAQASDVDRYSVVAIEDGSFDHATANAHYGPHVFGGGAVTMARNSAEYATLLGSACLNPPLRVVALEVTQVVQDWELSIPLVEAKPTLLRAFIESPSPSMPEVSTTGLLYGSSNGVDLPGSPLAPINPSGRIRVSGTDASAGRHELSGALNFALPPFWTVGSVDLSLELPGGAICSDEALPDSTCSLSYTYSATTPMNLRAIALGYPDGEGGFEFLDDAELDEQAMRIRSNVPTHVNWTTMRLYGDFDGLPTSADALTELNRLRSQGCAFGGCDFDEHWLALLVSPTTQGRAHRPARTAVAYVGSITGRYDVGRGRNTATHEIGHNLGRYHTVDAAGVGHCGESAPDSAPAYPYFHELEGRTYPTLGPLGDPLTEIWGFDTRFMHDTDDALAISNPYTTMPVMSYCNYYADHELSLAGQVRWISGPAYTALFSHFSAGGPSTGGAPPGSVFGDFDALHVSGSVNLDTGQASFARAAAVPSDGISFDSEGDYVIELFDEEDDPIDSVEFDLSISHEEPATGFFDVFLPLPAVGIARAVISDDSQELGSVEAGAEAPTVAITAPAGSTSHSGPTVTIQWTASDDDADDLSFDVWYSADDGDSWEALAAEMEGTTIEVERSYLAGSTEARVMVLASDGLNSAHAVSDPFTVAPNEPRITIESPLSGQVFTGVQSVFMRARAFDREDGTLTGSAITWSSDVDGLLGDGEELVVQATDLSEGTHTLTATVTDSDSDTAFDTVEIEVYRIGPSAATPREAKEDVRDALTALHPTGVSGVDGPLNNARGRVNQSLNPSLWADDETLTGSGGWEVFERELGAVRELNDAIAAAVSQGDPGGLSAILTGHAAALAEVDHRLALTATNIAIAAGADPGSINVALARIAQGEGLAAEGEYDLAIFAFRKAWQAVAP